MINTEHLIQHKLFNKETNKTQILLAHTSCSISDYFTRIKLRNGGQYKNVFTYTVDKKGNIYQHYNPKYYSHIFNIPEYDKQIISIGLENEGWLKSNIKTNDFFDWKGTIYKGEVKKKSWRGHDIWAVYTEEQINATCDLINILISEHKIKTEFSGNNLPIKQANQFEGILNRSNYFQMYYDLSPACDFDIISNKIKK